MTGRAIFILAVLALGYLLVFGGSSTSATMRKRISIQVATPAGVKSSASVIETRRSRAPWWFPSGSGRNASAMRGEAPYVELGDGRYLFVAVNNHVRERPIKHALESGLNPDGSFSVHGMPLLLTFSDITNPNTVKRVDPDDLDAAFGPGHRLLSLTATDTSERASQGTLAGKFPELHRELNRSVMERVPDASSRDDLRTIGWYTFEARDW